MTVESDDKAFQKLKTVDIGDASFPITLKSGDSVILDFGDHNVDFDNTIEKEKVIKVEIPLLSTQVKAFMVDSINEKDIYTEH